MTNFIDIRDYEASIHQEILSALVRNDAVAIELCEDRAIEEMKCYLSRRYDTNAIFDARGDERNQLVLMMALDIAVYHIFCIHNPIKITSIRKDRYQRAKEWLEAVANELITISGAPMLPSEQQISSDPFMISSNPKRHNHF